MVFPKEIIQIKRYSSCSADFAFAQRQKRSGTALARSESLVAGLNDSTTRPSIHGARRTKPIGCEPFTTNAIRQHWGGRGASGDGGGHRTDGGILGVGLPPLDPKAGRCKRIDGMDPQLVPLVGKLSAPHHSRPVPMKEGGDETWGEAAKAVASMGASPGP